MEHICCENDCGADACKSCGACLTEHTEDPVDNCPKNPKHRTTTNCERIKELEAENDKFKDALIRIDTWAKAYPLDIFLKPDLKQAAKVLKAAGMTLGAISTDAMRHVIDGVKDITKQALEGGK